MSEPKLRKETKYICTILVGDEYHQDGEEHVISEWNVEKTQKYGLRLEVEEPTPTRDRSIYHLYPCSIKKVTYLLQPIDIVDIEGGDRDYKNKTYDIIGYDRWEYDDYDWTQHWP